MICESAPARNIGTGAGADQLFQGSAVMASGEAEQIFVICAAFNVKVP